MTQPQMYANMANAKLSTGPTTEAGKEASSANALKHGLTAQKIVVMPGEDEAAYYQLRDGMFTHWKPANPEEEGLVQILADTQWRMNRVSSLEARCWAGAGPNFTALDNISKHGARLEKLYFKTLQEIRTLTSARRKREEAQMIEAMVIRRAGKIEHKDVDPRELGFVFSREQVDTAIRRQEAFEIAKKVVAAAAAAQSGARSAA